MGDTSPKERVWSLERISARRRKTFIDFVDFATRSRNIGAKKKRRMRFGRRTDEKTRDYYGMVMIIASVAADKATQKAAFKRSIRL